jgi:hypothetical protein
MLTLDAAVIAGVFTELLFNAKHFGTGETLVALAKPGKDQVAFELREPKREAIDTTGWGSTPLVSTRRHGYGLGLWDMDRAVRANHGQISRCYLPQERCLLTTLCFPTE